MDLGTVVIGCKMLFCICTITQYHLGQYIYTFVVSKNSVNIYNFSIGKIELWGDADMYELGKTYKLHLEEVSDEQV